MSRLYYTLLVNKSTKSCFNEGFNDYCLINFNIIYLNYTKKKIFHAERYLGCEGL